MKKIIIFILAFSITNFVYASEWMSEKPESNNIVSEYRYRFYEEVIEGEYLTSNLDNKYQYVDYDNILNDNYSAWTSSCEKESTSKEEKTRYTYKELKKINYIKISNPFYYEMTINNISLSNAKYFIRERVNCNNNNTIDEKFEPVIINKNGYIILELDRELSLEDFLIDILVKYNNTEYYIYLSNTFDFEEDSLIAKIKAISSINTYSKDSSWKLYDNYITNLTTFDFVKKSDNELLKEEIVCRYKEDIKYYFYNINKIYFDDNYYKDVSDLGIPESAYDMYKKDTEDYKIYYRYKTKEEIANNINFINETPVKTGIYKEKNYKYLIIYTLSLILLALVMLKKAKNKSIKK